MARQKSVGGRLVVLGLFWGLFAYLTTALVGSVFMSLYGRPPSQAMWSEETWRTKQRLWCLARIGGLKDELEAEIVHELSHPELEGAAQETRWRIWTEAWNAKFEEGEQRCTFDVDPLLPTAYIQLRALYEGYANGLAKIEETRGAQALALEESLRAMKGIPGGAPVY